VNLKFQLRYCFILMGIGLGFAVIAGVYAYTFLRVTIMDLVGNNPKLLDHYLLPFVATFVVVSAGFTVMLFLAGRILSQRIAGPLYAFERFLDDALMGKRRTLRLRSGDEFKHLESLAARILDELAARSVPGHEQFKPGDALKEVQAATAAQDPLAPKPVMIDGVPVGGAALRRTSGDPR
jgi:hypothetical protein